MNDVKPGTQTTKGELCSGDSGRSHQWVLPDEQPVAFRINDEVYAVMLATPLNLIDFARGFCLSEGLIRSPADIVSVREQEIQDGFEVDIQLTEQAATQIELKDRRRRLAGASGCGICGLNAISHVVEPLPEIVSDTRIPLSAVSKARDALRDHTPLNRDSFTVHGAALADSKGQIVLAREDVGRHNALDKLIGAVGDKNMSFSGHFVILTSRFAYELAQKCVRVGIPIAVSISAPTSIAVELAKASGMTLASFSGKDSLMVFSCPGRICK